MFEYYFLLTIITVSYGRYFDVCPSRKISIGACLAGLCPLGSECINNYCCKSRVVTTTPENEEIENYGKCRDGLDAIGECVSELCPSGYTCIDGLCCEGNYTTTVEPSTTAATASRYKSRAKTFVPLTTLPITPPSIFRGSNSSEELEVVNIIDITVEPNVNVDRTTSQVGNGGENTNTIEWVETTTMDMKELENTRNTFKALKSKESREIQDIRSKKKNVNFETTQLEIERTRTTPRTTQRSTFTTAESTTASTWEYTSPAVEMTTEQMQICPIGDSIGECISDQCPQGHTCFQNACCIITPQINCTDSLGGCLPHLCEKRGYKEFMTSKCAKTCARCHASELVQLQLVKCQDRRSDCKEWVAEGFCESSLYSTRQKLKFCGKSCKLC